MKDSRIFIGKKEFFVRFLIIYSIWLNLIFVFFWLLYLYLYHFIKKDLKIRYNIC